VADGGRILFRAIDDVPLGQREERGGAGPRVAVDTRGGGVRLDCPSRAARAGALAADEEEREQDQGQQDEAAERRRPSEDAPGADQAR
jgi:hypothetical protein